MLVVAIGTLLSAYDYPRSTMPAVCAGARSPPRATTRAAPPSATSPATPVASTSGCVAAGCRSEGGPDACVGRKAPRPRSGSCLL